MSRNVELGRPFAELAWQENATWSVLNLSEEHPLLVLAVGPREQTSCVRIAGWRDGKRMPQVVASRSANDGAHRCRVWIPRDSGPRVGVCESLFNLEFAASECQVGPPEIVRVRIPVNPLTQSG